MALNTPENRQKLIDYFPKLGKDSLFNIQSPETGAYNCIAWAMGFDDRWVDPLPDNHIAKKKWWPEDIARDCRPKTLIAAFEKLGFIRCDDGCIENGYDKVALYKLSPFYDPFTSTFINEGWTHAARIVSTEMYHSKIGPAFDIYHRNGDVFEGTSYGEIYQFMKRKKEDFAITERIKNEESVIEEPDDIIDIIKKTMFG